MNKLTFILIGILLTFSNLFAANRDSADAQQLALSFFNKSTSTSGSFKAPAVKSSLQLIFSKPKRNDRSSNYYYVFNKTENPGFVIVSGNENTSDILAYSYDNSFDPQNIPDNVKYWLSFYESEMDNLKFDRGNMQVDNTILTNKVNSSSTTALAAVSPLLGEIKWNQDEPYNNLCPIYKVNERSVTGCVATGMAQVMKYYQWPVTGSSYNSYTTASYNIPLSVDFSLTSYDWANMTDTYDSNSTTTENLAVATLMYHCGVSVNMNYAEASGAASTAAAIALINKFGYDSNIQHIYRDYYTRDEWKDIIKAELSAARPVLYGGDTGTSGHFFVCDGYDSNDFFHFNWGWGGMSNGYFRISALDPTDQGIGSGTGGYNNSQIIIVGIQKPTPTSTPMYVILSGDTLTYPADSLARNASFTIKANSVYNHGINSFAGKIGLALFDSNSTYISNIDQYQSNMSIYAGGDLYFSNIKIAAGLANGNYKIYCVYKSSAENDWHIVRAQVGTPNYIDLVVKSNYIYFNTPTNEVPILQLNSLTKVGNLYNNKIGRINASITNTGKEYNSLIRVQLQSTSDINVTQDLSTKTINIASGETRELTFSDSIKLPAGTYFVNVLYTPKNKSDYNDLMQLDNPTAVTILETPTGSANLSLLAAISFPDATKVDKKNALLSAQITNTGSLFDKRIIAFVFPKLGGTSLTYLGPQDIMIDENETKTLTFQESIDLPLGEYFLAIYYQGNQNEWIGFTPTNYAKLDFTLINDLTDINTIATSKEVMVFPNPATDHIAIQSDNEIRSYRIFNLMGEEVLSSTIITTSHPVINVASLNQGTYLVRIETEVGISNLKFIKK